MRSLALGRGQSAAILRWNRVANFTEAFFKASLHTSKLHPSAIIHSSAKVSNGHPIGSGCHIGALSYIGEDVIIGDNTVISANVTLQNVTIGNNVVVHPGARIGQDGFGFMLHSNGEHAKKPQQLRVEVHDYVEIGWRDTVIGQNCKLDNLIQIGHNVQLGTGCVIAAQTGIAGSTMLGNNVHIGGQVGVAQHLQIGDNVRIAAKSGVMHHLESNATYGGSPAVPIMEYRRQMAFFRQQGHKKRNDGTSNFRSLG
ncbi:hypothetical protein CCR75_002862 [Bremia lactucae]|uniref:UDP-3-O-[3-hydroxymyristoyl] glucosamine N-acyltransferase n=1 Tax=Bremia lactucae TaxID=4779 RepID=A0A976IEW0_BRELC|nr:hypothetical protein CCR75_002862 [Bremia lactucae]